MPLPRRIVGHCTRPVHPAEQRVARPTLFEGLAREAFETPIGTSPPPLKANIAGTENTADSLLI